MSASLSPTLQAPGTHPSYDKSVLGKAHLILGAFGQDIISLRLSELCQRSGLNKATAYRLAQELVHWGFLERRGEQYQLGVRIFEMSQRVPITAALRQIARPVLTDLFASTHATIHLSILDGWNQVLCVEKVAGRASILSPSDVGTKLPSSCTASGKILLANRLAPEQHHILAQLPLVRLTDRSVSTLAALKQQLNIARTRGFAVEVGEVRAECTAIAVPVVDYAGVTFAALAATVRPNDINPEKLEPSLKSASAAIGRMVDRWTMSNSPYSLVNEPASVVS